MRRNVIETIMGAAVLIVAGAFIVFVFTTTGLTTGGGYTVSARFDNAAGLNAGTDVRMSGVRVGSVVSQRLDSETYFAEVTLSIESDIRLPRDTSARIVPDGLMGGNYVALDPGGDEEMIDPGGRIQYTQGAVNIMDLVTRYMFSGNQGAGQPGGDGGMPEAVPQ